MNLFQALVQENHGLRQKNDILEKIKNDLENEVTTFLARKDNELSRQQNLQVDLEAAIVKVRF